MNNAYCECAVCQDFDYGDDCLMLGYEIDPIEEYGFSIYSISDILRDMFKDKILEDWPWLSSICNKEDIPNEMIDNLITLKLKTDEQVLLDKQFLSKLRDIINNNTLTHRLVITNEDYILLEKYLEKDALIETVLNYVEDLELLETFVGENTTGRHSCKSCKTSSGYCAQREKINI